MQDIPLDVWDAGKLLHGPLLGDLEFALDLTRSGRRHAFLLSGLRSGFYPSGKSDTQRIYVSILRTVNLPGMWVCRGRQVWAIHVIHVPDTVQAAIHERHCADLVAAKISGMEPPRAKADRDIFSEVEAYSHWFPAYTRTLQDKHWLKDLSKTYVDERYRQRIEPYIKRVENGKLVVRRINGRWSIG